MTKSILTKNISANAKGLKPAPENISSDNNQSVSTITIILSGLFLGFCFLFSYGAFAQINTYNFSQGTGTYTPITGGTVLATSTISDVTTTDDAVYAIAHPFAFTFNNVVYTSGTLINISTNGFITFGITSPGSTNYAPISATSTYSGVASALGSDISGSNVNGSLGELRYQVTGATPNRILVIQWKNFMRYSGGYLTNDNLNFQIRLYESSNTIDFMYGSFTLASNLTATEVGLRGNSNSDYNNRFSTSGWSATASGSSFMATVSLSSAIKPASGLTFTFAPSTAPCTAPPTGGTTNASPAISCGSTISTLSLTSSASGTGVTYQWQKSATGLAGSFTNVPGNGTNASYIDSAVSSTTYYRALVTCSGQTTASTPAAVTINPITAPYASLPYNQGFESWTSVCGNTEIPGINWRANPIYGDESWRRHDQGFSTAGWSFITSEPTPYLTRFSEGSYSARFHTYGAFNTEGWLDLYADLSDAGTKTLTFDYINPSGADFLEVLLSADGGVTFNSTPLITLGTSANFSKQSIIISGTSATSIIRFRAVSDYGDDDIGIDDLSLFVTQTCASVGFLPAKNITKSSATIYFTPATGATDYTVSYSPGGTPFTVSTADSVNLTGLSPYTQYTVTVTTNCASQTATATTTFRTAIGNDDCSGAITLTPGTAGATCNPSIYTTTGATDSNVTGPCSGAADDDVWFSFTATNSVHSIRVTPTHNFDAVVELRTAGSCPGSAITCQNTSNASGGGGTETLTATSLVSGTTYYLRVYNSNSGSGSGDFDICITTPANLTCSQVTNAAITNTGSTPTASSAELNFTGVSGASNYLIAIKQTSGGTISYINSSGSPVNLTGMTPATSYTVSISTNCINGSYSAPVNVVFTSAAPPATPGNNTCAGAKILTPGAPGASCATTSGTTVGATASGVASCTGDADDDVWYTFTATSTSHTIIVNGNSGFDVVADLRSGVCAGSTIVCRDVTASGSETLVATGLTVGDDYFIRVYDYYTGVYGTFSICITTPSTPPANDNCAGAIELTPGANGAACASTGGTTVGATASGITNSCSGNADDDVWYWFTATRTAHTVTVSGGAGFDAALNLRSGSCAGTSIACADNTSAAGTESISATGLTIGNVYFIRVYDIYTGASGNFSICITTPGNLVVNGNQSLTGTYYDVTIQAGTATVNAGFNVLNNLTVKSGAALETGTRSVSGNIFTLEAGGILQIGSADGITAAPSNTGNIRFNTRNLSEEADYIYNGAGSQNTGNGLPETVKNLTINKPSGNLTLTSTLGIFRMLTLTQGNLILGANALTLLSDAQGTAMVVNNGTAVVTGTATVQRFVNVNPFFSGTSYHHYASPVVSAPVSDLASGSFAPVVNPLYNSAAKPSEVRPFPNVFGFMESRFTTSDTAADGSGFVNAYYSPNSLSETLTPGRGYTVNKNRSTVDLSGTLNNGAVSVGALSHSGATTGANAGWHLLGNPYPAPIDWNLVTRPTGMAAAVYAYQSTSRYAGTYRAYIPGGPQVSGYPLLTDGIIPAMQGFFVRVTQDVPAFSFQNSARLTSYENPDFYRTTSETRPVVQLNLTNGQGKSDALLVYLEDKATLLADAEFDAYKIMATETTVPNLFAITPKNEALAISGIPASTENLHIPLGLQVDKAGSYSITTEQLVNFPVGAEVYLEDKLNKTLQALKAGTELTVSLQAGANSGRFVLRIPATSKVTSLALNQVVIYPNPTNQKAGFTVQLTGLKGEQVQAWLYNGIGQLMTSKIIIPDNSHETILFETGKLAKGVYTLRLTNNNHSTAKKIVVQ